MPSQDRRRARLLGSFGSPVEAAGALCWRRDPAGQLRVLLVRSARWDEWSWPKGKAEADERLAETAIREVLEETGVRAVLGPPLPNVRYLMPDHRHKRVTYWSAQPAEEGQPTASRAEIADLEWVSVGEARQRLTRPSDHPPLDRLLELDRQGQLAAGQLIVVRHAKSVSRSSWKGDDAGRPLAEAGLDQSARLARLLDCWRPDRLISSPWTRCLATLAPYEAVSGLTVQSTKQLTERSYARHPRRTRSRVLELLTEPGHTVICTHRPVLAGVVNAIATQSDSKTRARLPDTDPWLAAGQVLIAHHHRGRVFWAELP